MLLWITDFFVLNLYSVKLYKYSIVFRSVGSFFMSLIVSLILGCYVIKYFRDYYFFQSIRTDGPKSHLLKQGTPTMGGIVTLISVILSVIVWSDLSNLYIWYILFIFLTYGILGGIDDFLKIKRQNACGLSIFNKYLWQSFVVIVLIAAILIVKPDESCIQLNFWSILLAYFAIVGTSNAVNLSDGLDGLAIIPVILIAIGLALITAITSSLYFSNYLHISYIFYVKELIIVCVAIIGSGIGLLWFNTYPAQIFMGDIGSLSLGGVIGVIAVLLNKEYLLLIMGGILVIESLSVIFQVSVFKIFKRRIFKMAPIHHHFELKGYAEPKIVVRFWIISFIFMLFGIIIFLNKII